MKDKVVKDEFFMMGYRNCRTRASVRGWWTVCGISRTARGHLKGWMGAMLMVKW